MWPIPVSTVKPTPGSVSAQGHAQLLSPNPGQARVIARWSVGPMRPVLTHLDMVPLSVGHRRCYSWRGTFVCDDRGCSGGRRDTEFCPTRGGSPASAGAACTAEETADIQDAQVPLLSPPQPPQASFRQPPFSHVSAMCTFHVHPRMPTGTSSRAYNSQALVAFFYLRAGNHSPTTTHITNNTATHHEK